MSKQNLYGAAEKLSPKHLQKHSISDFQFQKCLISTTPGFYLITELGRVEIGETTSFTVM